MARPAHFEASNLPHFLRARPDGSLLSLRVQPRSSRNEIGQPLGKELRVKVSAPPVDSAANEALLCFLAERLGCPRSRVRLVRGHTSRHKVVKLHGFTAEEVATRLIPHTE